jgi:hypothetical protein
LGKEPLQTILICLIKLLKVFEACPVIFVIREQSHGCYQVSKIKAQNLGKTAPWAGRKATSRQFRLSFHPVIGWIIPVASKRPAAFSC